MQYEYSLPDWTNFTRGDLFRRMQAYNWDLAASFAADETDFCDVKVITLKEHLYNLAVDHTFQQNVDLDDVDSYIDKLLQTQYCCAKEFIQVLSDQIIVGVNRPKVDDRAIDHAMTLLIELQSTQVGTTQYFGEQITVYGNTTNDKQAQ